jgi:phosphoglycerate dehydrogenase-like enzyme
MTKILITEFINQDSLNDLNNIFEIKFDEKLWEKNEELTEIIKDYEGLIVRNKTQVSKHILSNAKNFKIYWKVGCWFRQY